MVAVKIAITTERKYMIKESLTTLQALVLAGITFAWGLRIGNKKYRNFSACMMIILGIIAFAIA